MVHIPSPFSGESLVDPNFSRCLQSLCQESLCNGPPQLWIKIPFMLSLDDTDSPADGWKIWNDIIARCDHSSRLFVALDLSQFVVGSHLLRSLSENVNLPSLLMKWKAEAMKAIIINTRCFTLRSKTSPSDASGHRHSNSSQSLSLSLPRVLRGILVYFFKFNIHVVISGATAEGLPFRR